MNIQNKVFVVTGAGGGIGGAIVSGLLQHGAKVAAVDLNDESLQQLIQTVGDKSGNISTHALNITDRHAVAKLPDAVLSAHGTIDAVINCAGIVQPFVKINDLDFDAIERVMNVNFYGTLYMTKAMLPHLLQRSEAYIVNTSSMGGFLPVPGQSVYGASKAAVKLLTEGLYAELLNTNVHVTVVFPGATRTNITANSGVTVPTMRSSQAQESKIPMLSPDQVANIVIKGIEKNKPQIFTGSDSNLFNAVYRISPIFATKFITKQMKSLLGS